MSLDVRGIVPPIITPYDEEGEVDEEKLRRFIDYVMSGGVHAVFPLGTNGEGPLLTMAEKKRVIETTVEHIAGRIPVLAGTGSPSTKESITLSQHAEVVGADAVCVVNPYYYPTTQSGVVEHYRKIADSIDIPVYVYYIPGKTGNNINVEKIAKIAEIPGVIGLKDSSKDIGWFYNSVNRIREKDLDFSFLGGSDALIYTHLSLGSAGSVSSVANVFPELVVTLYEEYQEGRFKKAKEVQDRVLTLRGILKTGPYLSGVKEALKVLGFDFGQTRSPLQSMSEGQRTNLRKKLIKVGAIDENDLSVKE